MTPGRGRGRPRSEERRDAVLKAAMELMQEDDLRRASVDRISACSGVSKATIYKWWPNRTAVTLSNPLDGDGPLDARGCRGVSGEIVEKHWMAWPRCGRLGPSGLALAGLP